MVSKGGVVKRGHFGFFLKKNVANKKIHHTRAKHMIHNPVIVGRVYLLNTKLPHNPCVFSIQHFVKKNFRKKKTALFLTKTLPDKSHVSSFFIMKRPLLLLTNTAPVIYFLFLKSPVRKKALLFQKRASIKFYV